MKKVIIKPFNVIDNTKLPSVLVNNIPVAGDPVEIDNEMYFTCETGVDDADGVKEIGVIPLVVRNPRSVINIGSYMDCLTIAHRRMQFRKDNNICDFDECDEMRIL